ncbi:hypothetical protein N7456_002523 [Penicillium angulare]|uniref:Amidohydrolase-related domain-containing protein n=1 Tax=Penicillium angulare TaxID=116970 RepID=A0A9W9G8M3_9EURO|nr:hypothetical protein N7456_002523 [Penicillium angulare]
MPLAIRADRLLTSSLVEVIQDGVAVVDGETIVQVGSWIELSETLTGIPIKELGDVTLMPGLFDCHVHLQMDPSAMGSTEITLSDEELLPLIRKNAAKLLDAGVTTARDLGSRGQTVITIRDRIARHEVPGPRLQSANAPLTVPGGHACSMGGECIGIEQCRQGVRSRHAEGADVIKVMSTGGFMTPNSHVWEARYSQEEMNAFADEAHKWGLPITTHAVGTEGIARAVNAGFDSIEHCSWLAKDRKTHFDSGIAKQMFEKGVAVVPTMNTACTHDNFFCPWDERQAIINNLSAVREAGIQVAVGTDAGIGHCHFERYADGLSAMADAGFTNQDIIASATERAAKICGLDKVTGKIAVGFAADLAAFGGNPAQDWRAFTDPRFVMARGEIYEQQAIAPLEDLSEIKGNVMELLRRSAGV